MASWLLFNAAASDLIFLSFLAAELKALNLTQLNELYMEMEELIRDYSETLIAELALRDELEYEKELKNTFISLLLAVQNRRRQHNVEKKRNSRNTPAASSKNNNSLESKARHWL